MEQLFFGWEGAPYLVAVLGILVGILFTFFGYRVFKIVLAIAGFILGYYLGSNLASFFAPPLWIITTAGIAGGIILALLSTFIYYLGVFVLGAYLGSIAGFILIDLIGYPLSVSIWMWIIVVVLAVGAGVLALVFHRVMIVICSSFAGAWMLVTGLTTIVFSITGPVDGNILPYIFYTVWIALGIVGMIVQFKVTARKKLEEDRIKVK